MFFYAGIFTIVFALVLGTLLDDKISHEKKKVEQLTTNEIFDHYQKKNKNIDGKKINKNLKELTLNQKDILKLIQKHKLFKKSFSKIQKMLIKEKLENTAQSEFDLKKDIIEEYINNQEKLKDKNKYNEIINKYFEIDPKNKKEIELKKPVLLSKV